MENVDAKLNAIVERLKKVEAWVTWIAVALITLNGGNLLISRLPSSPDEQLLQSVRATMTAEAVQHGTPATPRPAATERPTDIPSSTPTTMPESSATPWPTPTPHPTLPPQLAIGVVYNHTAYAVKVRTCSDAKAVVSPVVSCPQVSNDGALMYLGSKGAFPVYEIWNPTDSENNTWVRISNEFDWWVATCFNGSPLSRFYDMTRLLINPNDDVVKLWFDIARESSTSLTYDSCFIGEE